MYVFTQKRPRQAHFLALAAITAALCLGLGMPVLFLQSARALDTDAGVAGTVALARIEGFLDNARDAAAVAAELNGFPCDQAGPALRRQVASAPYVRSVNLVRDGLIYCGSISSGNEASEEAGLYADGRLRLMAGNQVTPDRALLIYRAVGEAGAVLAAIDGQHLMDALSVRAGTAAAALAVGSASMNASGRVEAASDQLANTRFTLQSTRYPIHVTVGFPSGEYWRSVRDRLPALGLLWAGLLGVGVLLRGKRDDLQLRDVRRGIAANEFVPHYQPIVDVDGMTWKGTEVLVRWAHPKKGLLPAGAFIELAEESGLIIPITQKLMKAVARDFAGEQDALPEQFYVSINITSAHCKNEAFVADCRELAASLDRVQLVLELTEREAFVEAAEARKVFDVLRHSGIKLAIDDFGTGHSSLNYLKEFAVDIIKIDRQFALGLASDNATQNIVANIIDLADRFGLCVIAEGVDNEGALSYMRKMGVRYIQGFYFARPIPAQALFQMLRKPVAVASAAKLYLPPERQAAGVAVGCAVAPGAFSRRA
jgi:EAL domain-containing protein (putative c-di-GMP-specific phosphodiesterase class I)